VHSFQDKLSLVPLSAYGKNYIPPAGKFDPDIDTKTSTKDQVTKMDAAAYFRLLATLKDNPPTDADAPMVALYRQLSRCRSQPGRQEISGYAGGCGLSECGAQ
jgi:hypothetical protein